jgi:hypothetical protein
MSYIYYPITYYHLLLSIVMRESCKKNKNSIILDENKFDKYLIDRIEKTGAWDEIYIIGKKSKFRTRLNILFSNMEELNRLHKIKNENLIIFSPGDFYCVNFANILHKNNSVFMGEDGAAPYYFENLQRNWDLAIEAKFKIDKIKQIISYYLNPNFKFTTSILSSLLIFRKDWISDDVQKSIITKEVQTKYSDIKKACEEFNIILDYNQKKFLPDIDIIYFDAGSDAVLSKKNEFDMLCNLFRKFKNKTIFVKLRPYDVKIKDRLIFFDTIMKKTACKFILNPELSNYPWEIIYYNNKEFIKNATFIASYFSSALISPTILYGIRHETFILSDILYRNNFKYDYYYSPMLKSCIDRINKSHIKEYIHFPQNISDVG